MDGMSTGRARPLRPRPGWAVTGEPSGLSWAIVRGVSRWSRRDRLALAAAVAVPPAVSLMLVPFRGGLVNTHVALVLVVVIVAVAAAGDRLAGIVASISAGFWFDFFFTAPYQRLAITDSQDVETFLLLLAVGIAVTELAVWGRRQQERSAREAGYLAGLQAAAAAGATGTPTTTLVRDVRSQLIDTLDLSGCRFEPGVAGLGDPPRLLRDGSVVWHGRSWDADRDGLPGDTDIELRVEHSGRLHGRYVLRAKPGTRPSREQRMVAVTLADQVGAALG